MAKVPKPTNKRDEGKPQKAGFFTTKTIIGFLMLLVVGSIAFSSYIVYFGTTDIMAKLMLVPQLAFAVFVLVRQFIK